MIIQHTSLAKLHRDQKRLMKLLTIIKIGNRWPSMRDFMPPVWEDDLDALELRIGFNRAAFDLHPTFF